MFEAHFGFSAPPFQLSPDPDFFFESQGHARALRYMRYGIYQGEGFVVVTGEIGSGKTLLVRTLLDGLSPAEVAAVHLVSTRLDAVDLLQAVGHAFGVQRPGASKATLLTALEAFLLGLAARGRRALVVVDEAQNLAQDALEELRMLGNFQLGRRALLQSFLVGQAQLRDTLRAPGTEQLRQRVLAACHLGPLSDAETLAYVQHRLRRVGWTGRPELTNDAFAAIHATTGGVPRLINALCTRALLGAWAGGSDRITAADVAVAADELRDERGDPRP
jgi:general secretion pathway protein A